MRRSLVGLLVVSACVTEPAGDGKDDGFRHGTGKTDGTVADGDPDAVRALRVANTGDATALETQVGLAADAAAAIVARRAGADGTLGTTDDAVIYTLDTLDAIDFVGQTAFDHLVAYGKANPDVLGTRLVRAALPAGIEPDQEGWIAGIAEEPSLQIDDDATSLLASEWEQGLLFAHHFTEETASRIAPLRRFLVPPTARRGPFIDIATINRTYFGEGEISWMLGALLRRTAVDPRHTPGRIYPEELDAALADADFVARFPQISVLDDEYRSQWNAQVSVTVPPGFPAELARYRAILTARGVPTFDAAYPPDLPLSPAVAAVVFPLPFLPGTEIVCEQANNTMAANTSHAPNELRYALDLDAPMHTPVVASRAGTAYVYDNGRPDSFDNYGYGNMLLIDLHDGYALLYAHLATFAVVTGQDVQAGQVVGGVGITGGVGGAPHLHVQVVGLFRTPDPEHEKYQSDTPIAHDGPFNGPEPYILSAIDVTAGDLAAHPIDSTAFVGGQAEILRGLAHLYRAP